MPGRKAVPTATKILNGNPGKRALNDREAEPPPKLPRAPTYLSKAAKAEWRRMGGRLLEVGLMTALDETALAAYCQAFSNWVDANKEIQEQGATVWTAQGGLARSPWVSIAAEAWKEMTRMLGEFGMTPSSRSKVKVARDAPAATGDDWFGDAHRN